MQTLYLDANTLSFQEILLLSTCKDRSEGKKRELAREWFTALATYIQLCREDSAILAEFPRMLPEISVKQPTYLGHQVFPLLSQADLLPYFFKITLSDKIKYMLSVYSLPYSSPGKRDSERWKEEILFILINILRYLPSVGSLLSY